MWRADVTYSAARNPKPLSSKTWKGFAEGGTAPEALRSAAQEAVGPQAGADWAQEALRYFDPEAQRPMELVVPATDQLGWLHVRLTDGSLAQTNHGSILAAPLQEDRLWEVRVVMTDRTEPQWPLTWLAQYQGRPLWAPLGSAIGRMSPPLASYLTGKVLDEHGAQKEARYRIVLSGEDVEMAVTISGPGGPERPPVAIDLKAALVVPPGPASEMEDHVPPHIHQEVIDR